MSFIVYISIIFASFTGLTGWTQATPDILTLYEYEIITTDYQFLPLHKKQKIRSDTLTLKLLSCFLFIVNIVGTFMMIINIINLLSFFL